MESKDLDKLKQDYLFKFNNSWQEEYECASRYIVGLEAYIESTNKLLLRLEAAGVNISELVDSFNATEQTTTNAGGSD